MKLLRSAPLSFALLAGAALACSSPGASSGAGEGGSSAGAAGTGPAGAGPGPGGSSVGGGGAGGTPMAGGAGPGGSMSSGGSSPALPCDPGFAFDSNPITTPIVNATYTNPTPFVYIDLEVSGPGMPETTYGNVVGSGPYTWNYTVSGYSPGVLTFTFVKDKNGGNPGTPVATCQLNALVQGDPTTTTTTTGGGLASCADLAAANDWSGGKFTCDVDGSKGWCAGTGTPTSDCANCCSPSCGVLASYYNSSASCDDGNNNACKGSGIITWDCKAGCCGPNIPNSGPPPGTGFGYPVGDKSTSPAGGGGWAVWQVLGDYWDDYGGAHLAEDIGKAGAANAPVHSVADGVVLVASPNGSSYVNVVLIQHTLGDGSQVCSFYGHLASLSVSAGQTVSRGDKIATLLDQGNNSHLHYFIAPKPLCDHIASLSGAGACGYDGSNGVPGLGHSDIVNEPASYSPMGSNNGCSLQGYTIFAPHKYIDAHHF